MSTAALLTPRGATDWCAGALRRVYGSDAKAVARDAESTVDAAYNWLEGRNSPTLPFFLRIAHRRPEFRDELRRILQLDPVDPETERAVDLLVQSYLRRNQERLEAAHGDG